MGLTWYYKADAAPYDTNCYSSRAGGILAHLRPNTPYTFSAYSDSACTPANRLVTAETFTIRQLEPLPQCDGIAIRQEFEAGSGTTKGPSDVVISNETDSPIQNVEIELFRLKRGLAIPEYKGSLSLDVIADEDVNPEGNAPVIAFPARYFNSDSAPTTTPNTIIVDFPEIPANSTYRLSYQSRYNITSLIELNAVLTVSSVGDTPVALCRSHDSTWIYKSRYRHGYAQKTFRDFAFRTTVDDPLPATDGSGSVNFKISIPRMSYALAQSCVKLDISDGLTQNGSVTYTPATGTGDAMKYEDDGDDDYKRGYFGSVLHFRKGLCSDADGKYSGGIYHVGNWDYDVNPQRSTLEITVPFDVNDGVKLSEQCVTATLLYLPLRNAPGEKTSKVCLGAQPSGEPPALLRDGRADIITLYQCAAGDVTGGGVFPCQGKSTGDLALYVDGYRMAAEDTVLIDTIDASGSAAERAGAGYRLFSPESVIIHVPDVAARRARVNPETGNNPTYPVGNVWYTGNDEANDPDDTNDFGYIAGVSTRNMVLTGGGTFTRLFLSMCANKNATPTRTEPCAQATNSDNTNPGTLRGMANATWTHVSYNMAATTQPARNYPGNASYLTRDKGLGTVFEFSTLGTYRQDIVSPPGRMIPSARIRSTRDVTPSTWGRRRTLGWASAGAWPCREASGPSPSWPPATPPPTSGRRSWTRGTRGPGKPCARRSRLPTATAKFRPT